MKKAQPTYESISNLPIEERHAIVVSWLNTTTDFYERAAAQRDELRKELAKVRHAALAAYRVIGSDLEGYDLDSGPPPDDLLNAHALLFEALDLYQEPAAQDSADLPF